MKLVRFFLLTVSLLLAGSGVAFGEWPERGLTLVTSVPPTVPWSNSVTDTQADVLRALVPRFSRELGVPVNLVFRPAATGVLAGNMVAGAKPDGYVFGALGGDAAMGRVIQEYTPYQWSELVPVSTGWRTIYGIVVRADEPAADLLAIGRDKNHKTMRLAHTGLSPIHTPTLLAVQAAEKAGFNWELVKVEELNPDLILEDKVDAMVVPLGNFNRYTNNTQLKVITALTPSEAPPCALGLPTLATQNIEMDVNPPFAFYLPSKVNWRVRSKLSTAINNSLKQPTVVKSLKGYCFEPFLEDLEGVSAVLNREYKQQELLLKDVERLEKW